MSDAYHDDYDRISKSMLQDFANDRELYRLRYIDGKLPRRESSAAMDAGTAVHSVLLEGGELENYMRIVPDDCLQSNGAINGKRMAKLRDIHVAEVHGKFKRQEDMTEQDLQAKLNQLICECKKVI